MYRSPLHIIEGFESESDILSDKNALLKLRKKLLAEFNLTNSPTIHINGKDYSKDEVIRTIDSLSNDPNVHLHLFIFKDKNLLNFIEDDHSNVTPAIIAAISIPEGLKEDIHPLIAHRIEQRFRKALNTRQFSNATQTLQDMKQFGGELQEHFIEMIARGLLSLGTQINYVREHEITQMPSQLDYLKKHDLVMFLNNIPEELSDAVDDLISDIINAMVAFQKTSNHDTNYLFVLSQHLCEVKCREDLQELIRSNHKSFSGRFHNSEENSSFSVKYVFLTLSVIVLCARLLLTCNKSHRTYDHSKYNYSNLMNSEHFKKTDPENFETYRKHVKTSRAYMFRPDTFYDAELLSGKNPFRAIFKKSEDQDNYEQTKVLVHNRSGKHLVIISMSDKNANARMFARNRKDTLLYAIGSRLCFYFGDSLGQNLSLIGAMSSLAPYMCEAVFYERDSVTLDILQNDYLLTISSTGSKTKKNKKPKLPVLEITSSFFTEQEIVTEKILLQKVERKSGRKKTYKSSKTSPGRGY